MYQPSMTSMPDVASQKTPHQNQDINWVGMGELHQPLAFSDGETAQQVLASCEVFVNLMAGDVRGIHMSRLYLLISELTTCSKVELHQLLKGFINTHSDMSNAARLKLSFDLLLKRRALVSDNYGWRVYPITIDAMLDERGLQLDLCVDITYSSTCPCSKALAEQMVVRKFNEDMGEANQLSRQQVQTWLEKNAIYASPHSQRSCAQVRVRLPSQGDWGTYELVNLLEEHLQTAVQAAVKREDEQRFAVLNGQNPMFCEDAARIIKNALIDRYASFWLRVDHYESLHAHNAVAICSYP